MGKSNTYFSPQLQASIECQLLCAKKDKNKALYMIDDEQLFCLEVFFIHQVFIFKIRLLLCCEGYIARREEQFSLALFPCYIPQSGRQAHEPTLHMSMYMVPELNNGLKFSTTIKCQVLTIQLTEEFYYNTEATNFLKFVKCLPWLQK